MSTAAAKPKKLAKPVENNKKTTVRKQRERCSVVVLARGSSRGNLAISGGRPKGSVSRALFEQLVRKASKGRKSDLEAIVEAIVATAKRGKC